MQAHGRLGARSADESLDRPVGPHGGAIARPHARRALRADHHGTYEWLIAHCGGAAFPFIASQTRPGVAGMSMWRTSYGSSASMIAFITHGGDPTVADSPTPFAPIGWCGDGVTVSPS